MIICEGGGDGTYGWGMSFNGLLVYRVTVAEGFNLLGRISHGGSGSAYDAYGCGSWWTDSNSQVKRSIFMDDYVFSIDPERIKIDLLDSLGAGLAEVDLTD